MLERLRQSVAGMLAKILIGLLVISFALWGIGDVFGQNPDPVVAEVGNDTITANKFMRAFQQSFVGLQIEARNQDTQITVEQARAAGLDRQVLAALISRSFLEQSAAELGMTVSEAELLRALQKDETFLGPFGRFDPLNFRNVLQASGLSEEDYLRELKANLIRRQFESVFALHPEPTKIMLNAMLEAQTEKRTAKYILLKPNKKEKIRTPNQKELETFIDENPALFTLPEKRRFQVLLLDPDAFTKAVKISASQVRAEYQARKSEFQTPEERLIRQLVYSNKTEADAAYKKAKAGTSFARLAKQQGKSEESADLGWLTSGQYLNEKLEKAAQKLAPKKVSRPIETALGWHLLQVAEIKKGKQQPFSAVRAEIKKSLAYEKVLDEIDDLHDLIEDEIAGGEPFRKLAKKHKLKHVRSKALARSDELPKSLEAIPSISQRVWSAEEEAALESQSTPQGGYYWLAVDGIAPSRTQTLPAARKKAVALWKKDRRLKKTKEIAEKIINRVARGSSLAQASKQKPKRTEELSLAARSEDYSPYFLSMLFRTPKGRAFHAPAQDGDGLLVVEVAKVSAAKFSAEEEKQVRQNLQAEMNQLMTNELSGLYLAHQERLLKTNIYWENLNLAFEGRSSYTR